MEEKELMGSSKRVQQYFINRMNSGTTTTGTIIDRDEIDLEHTENELCQSFEHAADALAFEGSPASAVAVLVPYSPSGWGKNIITLAEGRRYFWQHTYLPQSVYASGGQPVVYGILGEYVGSSDDTLASKSIWYELWQEAEPQSANWRGVFYPTYDKKVLFSKRVTFHTAKLRRWKPKASIQIRRFDLEDDR